jgi:WD40 repeat protein
MCVRYPIGSIIALLLMTAGVVARAADWTNVYVQLGHSNRVFTVALSPDGRTLASGSADCSIKLWDMASGRELRTLNGNANMVSSVAFSPDGRTLASAGYDHTVRLWDVSSGRELHFNQFLLHADIVNAVAFSEDGKTLASASSDQTIKIWNVADGHLQRTLSGHSQGVNAVAFSADGHMLASGSFDSSIKLWDPGTGEQLRTLSGHSGAVTAVAFSLDGRRLLSGSYDKTVKVWDIASGHELRTLNGSSDRITSVAFTPDGRSAAAGSLDNNIKLWDLVYGAELRTFVGHVMGVTSVAFSADGRTLASGSLDHNIKLWDPASGRELRTLSGHTNFVSSIAYSPDGLTLAAGSHDHSIWLWDLARGRPPRLLHGHSMGVVALAYSPDGQTLASASEDATIKLWDPASGRELRTLSGHVGTVAAIAFSPDGRLLASAGADRTVKIWDTAGGRELRTLSGHSLAVRAVAFSPDGRTLISAGEDRSIKFWDPSSGQELRTSSGNPDAIYAIAYSPDGKTLAAEMGNRVELLDVGSGQELHRLQDGSGFVSLAFAPDGRTLATGIGNNTIRFFDVASGRDTHTFTGPTGVVKGLAYSPDGHTLASGGWDATVRLWNATTGRRRFTAIALDGADFLAITQEGYYDYRGSTAEQNLLVRTGPGLFDVTDISVYREKFYRPDLVRLSLIGRPLPDNLVALSSIKSAPDVSVDSVPTQIDGDNLDLQVRLTDRGGGIGEVRVFINGSAISETDGRGLRRNDSGTTSRLVTLHLLPGDNEIGVIAYNADGSMHSSPATVRVTANYTPKHKPELHALIVGINQFRNPALQLRYPVADATAVAQVLQRRAAPLFDKVDVQLLTTPETTTKAALLAAFARYRTLAPSDVFVFYVASHGTVENEDLTSREYFLISSNVGLTSDEALHRDAISQGDLKQLISSIPATKKVLLLDTCQSGALGDALALTTRGDDDQRAINILSGAVGSTVLSAATSQEQALEGMEGHGVFTWVVLQGLDGKADLQKNGYVSTLDLASYVGDQVPKIAVAIFKREQFPNLHNAGQSFPLVSSH